FPVVVCRLCFYRTLPRCLCTSVWGVWSIFCGDYSSLCTGRNSEPTSVLGGSCCNFTIRCLGRGSIEFCAKIGRASCRERVEFAVGAGRVAATLRAAHGVLVL